MNNEDITLSDTPASTGSWKEWAKEHWVFLGVMAILSATSVTLLIMNRIEHSRTARVAIPLQQPIDPLPQPPLPKPKPKKKGPLEKAKQLMHQGHIHQAIHLLLNVTRNTHHVGLKKKAIRLSKKYHAIKRDREELKRLYLEGYVLFRSYPEKACSRWKRVLSSPYTNDEYFQKAQNRIATECLSN